MASISPHLTPDVRSAMTLEASLRPKRAWGNAPEQVAKQRAELAALVDALDKS
jgi:hypothetical protein